MRRIIAVLVVAASLAGAVSAQALTPSKAAEIAQEHTPCGNFWTTRCESVHHAICTSTGSNRRNVAQYDCTVHYVEALIKWVVHRDCYFYVHLDPWGKVVWSKHSCGRWHLFAKDVGGRDRLRR